MDDLLERAAQLRAAAATFQQSSNTIQTIADHMHSVMDDLNAATDSAASDATFARYQQDRGWISEWAVTLHHFSENLNSAADQIEQTVQQNQEQHQQHYHWQPPTAEPEPLPPPEPEDDPEPMRRYRTIWVDRPTTRYQPHQVTDYLSSYNQGRYEQMLRDQQLLPAREAALETLGEQRTAAALSVRMLSEYAPIDEFAAKELARQQQHLNELDANYQNMAEQVRSIRDNIETVTNRLNMLTPTPEANLSLIRSMEGGRSPEWLKDNTFDCVRYVVSRVNVPPEIARDAYMWDDLAETDALQRYGVRVGREPLPGSILVMEREHPYADDRYGHVLVVERVDEQGGIWVTDHLNPNEPVLLQDLTTETRLHVKYLYLPWYTRA